MQERSLFDSVQLKPSPSAERRVLALVFPQLLCELIDQHLLLPALSTAAKPTIPTVPSVNGRQSKPRALPFAVVLTEKGQYSPGAPMEDAALRSNSLLHTVSDEARRLGVKAGQRIVEAQAVLASLQVFQITHEEVAQALGKLAEIVMDLGPTVSVGTPDTVWIDITGASHLRGGEAELLTEVLGRVRALGHRVRAAIAHGPLLARAFATWSVGSETPIVTRREAKGRIGVLPLLALPLNSEQLSFFARVGVMSVAQLQALPKASLSARLGESAGQILALTAGEDPAPLVAFQPPRVLAEQAGFAEGVSGVEPLLFVLRGLVARLSVRLMGRGEAAEELELCLQHDRKIAEFHGRPLDTRVTFSLASPLWKEEELLRVLRSKVERLKLTSPTVSVRLVVSVIVPAQSRQLTLSSVVGGLTERAFDESELAVLLAELNADIGKEHVGVLRLLDSHRPEAKSALFPVVMSTRSNQRRSKRKSRKVERATANNGELHQAAPQVRQKLRETMPTAVGRMPTRLLPKPILIDRTFKVGEVIGLGANLYTIERAVFDHRLEGVAWWSKLAVSRDYVRLWLKGSEGGVAALGYVNRDSGSHYIQAIYD
ncbi:MAG: DNA polymerase Y family protein [Polyangiaceae bacterium]|nr:DNA polymerase Y family protein [Polyangiaceae bacterium]